jgi:2-polyprenyl-3-methyl-5-hydroxy-6-metoxy-1,4-benzoquinol methylase
MTINEAKLQTFVARVLQDVGAAQSAALVVIGDQLGLYRAMAGSGPLTPEDLAARTGTSARYVREWLVNQAAGGYVEYEPGTGRFLLPEEQALVLATADSRAFLTGAFQMAAALVKLCDSVAEAFRTGSGIPYEAWEPRFGEGMDRSARAKYGAHLLASWIPALDGIRAKLEAGASVADIGCGRGAVLLLLARAFPRSQFIGFDTDLCSVEHARAAADATGLSERLRFELVAAHEFPGTGYDLITTFDVLHDLADPVACARQVRAALTADGTWLIVEPSAGDRLEENLGALGRLLSSTSVLHCLPVSLAQGGAGLGTLAGEARLREIVRAGGLTRVRRISETPLDLVLEARR